MPQATPPPPPRPPLPPLAPLDAANQALLAAVHPADWVNPAPQARYNLVVVGGGTAGLVCAAGAAGLGARVALAERHFMGGDCLNSGCVPSKALIRAARLVGEARRAFELGLTPGQPPAPDFAAVMRRLRELRAGLAGHDSAARFRELGVDVFLGRGVFVDHETLAVGEAKLRFAKAVIATGSTPGGLPFPGLRETGYLTNQDIFNLTQLPARLAVLGTGPIGCELAQAFSRLGSRVLMVGRSGQIMTREDPDAAAVVAAALVADGVDLRLNTEVTKVEASGAEKLIHIKRGEDQEAVAVDAILVGAGRNPVVEGLGLEAAGVEYDRKAGVRVDDHLRTTNPNVFAAGDVCLTHKFTHMADASARIVIQNALFAGRARLSGLTPAWCTYTDPEAAHCGLYPEEAEAQGLGVETIRIGLKDVDRAVLEGRAEGFLKVHLKAASDRILGATLVAPHAGESISQLTLAIQSGLGLKTLAAVIHPYPTQAEVIRKAADAYNRTRLTEGVKRWLQRWLAWRL
ncbi:MAG: mercuric reductase [Pseudomonadota bacterium]